MNEDRIKAKIRAREAARAAAGGWKPEPVEFQGDWQDAFFDEIRAMIHLAQPDPKPTPISRLGATKMPFGQHEGKTFDDTPLEYLDWLCRSQEDFYKSLRAYLKHPELESRRRGL